MVARRAERGHCLPSAQAAPRLSPGQKSPAPAGDSSTSAEEKLTASLAVSHAPTRHGGLQNLGYWRSGGRLALRLCRPLYTVDFVGCFHLMSPKWLMNEPLRCLDQRGVGQVVPVVGTSRKNRATGTCVSPRFPTSPLFRALSLQEGQAPGWCFVLLDSAGLKGVADFQDSSHSSRLAAFARPRASV